MSVPTFAPRNKSIYLTTSNAEGKVLSYDGNFGSSTNLKMSPPHYLLINDGRSMMILTPPVSEVKEVMYFLILNHPIVQTIIPVRRSMEIMTIFGSVIHRMNRIVMIRIPVSGDIGVMTVLV